MGEGEVNVFCFRDLGEYLLRNLARDFLSAGRRREKADMQVNAALLEKGARICFRIFFRKKGAELQVYKRQCYYLVSLDFFSMQCAFICHESKICPVYINKAS